jgi:hypothetical protein
MCTTIYIKHLTSGVDLLVQICTSRYTPHVNWLGFDPPDSNVRLIHRQEATHAQIPRPFFLSLFLSSTVVCVLTKPPLSDLILIRYQMAFVGINSKNTHRDPHIDCNTFWHPWLNETQFLEPEVTKAQNSPRANAWIKITCLYIWGALCAGRTVY